MTCTCVRDTNDELLPTGCAEHSEPYENVPGRHRFSEPDAAPLTKADRHWIGWVSLGCVGFWICFAGLVWAWR